jgi:hypothetical protein
MVITKQAESHNATLMFKDALRVSSMSKKRAQRSYYEINFAFQTDSLKRGSARKSGVRLWHFLSAGTAQARSVFWKCFRSASISSVII